MKLKVESDELALECYSHYSKDLLYDINKSCSTVLYSTGERLVESRHITLSLRTDSYWNRYLFVNIDKFHADSFCAGNLSFYKITLPRLGQN